MLILICFSVLIAYFGGTEADIGVGDEELLFSSTLEKLKFVFEFESEFIFELKVNVPTKGLFLLLPVRESILFLSKSILVLLK